MALFPSSCPALLHLQREVSLEDLYMTMVPILCTVCGKNLGMNLGSVFRISAPLLFLPPLLHPPQLIPKELQEKWQKDVDALHAKLGGTPERPIEIVIISLDTPDYLTVICAAGVRQLMLGSVGDVGMAQAMFSCHCWQPRCQQMLPTFVDQFQQFFRQTAKCDDFYQLWKSLEGKLPYLAKHENCQPLLDTKLPELE